MAPRQARRRGQASSNARMSFQAVGALLGGGQVGGVGEGASRADQRRRAPWRTEAARLARLAVSATFRVLKATCLAQPAPDRPSRVRPREGANRAWFAPRGSLLVLERARRANDRGRAPSRAVAPSRAHSARRRRCPGRAVPPWNHCAGACLGARPGAKLASRTRGAVFVSQSLHTEVARQRDTLAEGVLLAAHEGLQHVLHTAQVPAAQVGLERRRKVKHLTHVGDRASVPSRQVLVEGGIDALCLELAKLRCRHTG
eukprot:791186-Rhodomonas_salina.4